ncbi:MAG: hypothetical protein ACYSO4_01355, partial [Planctomycetota bacterium]
MAGKNACCRFYRLTRYAAVFPMAVSLEVNIDKNTFAVRLNLRFDLKIVRILIAISFCIDLAGVAVIGQQFWRRKDFCLRIGSDGGQKAGELFR